MSHLQAVLGVFDLATTTIQVLISAHGMSQAGKILTALKGKKS